MWNKIVNPKTGRKVNLNSKIGKNVLRSYIKQLGGANVHSMVTRSKDRCPGITPIHCGTSPNHPKCAVTLIDCLKKNDDSSCIHDIRGEPAIGELCTTSSLYKKILLELNNIKNNIQDIQYTNRNTSITVQVRGKITHRQTAFENIQDDTNAPKIEIIMRIIRNNYDMRQIFSEILNKELKYELGYDLLAWGPLDGAGPQQDGFFIGLGHDKISTPHYHIYFSGGKWKAHYKKSSTAIQENLKDDEIEGMNVVLGIFETLLDKIVAVSVVSDVASVESVVPGVVIPPINDARKAAADTAAAAAAP